jgi:hypothetical protein
MGLPPSRTAQGQFCPILVRMLYLERLPRTGLGPARIASGAPR